MATIKTVTLASAGADYSSLNAAIDGEAADLVALDRVVHIRCSGFEDNTAVAEASWTDYVCDSDHYVKIFAAEGSCSGEFTNRGSSCYYFKPTVNGSAGFMVGSGMYVHCSGIWMNNAGTGAGSCLFAAATDSVPGLIATERCGIINTGHVVNFNIGIGGMEYEDNSSYMNGGLETIKNQSNGEIRCHNTTIISRGTNQNAVNAAGFKGWNCYAACSDGTGTAYNSFAALTKCGADDSSGSEASLDNLCDWDDTHFVNATQHKDPRLTADGYTDLGAVGTEPGSSTRAEFTWGVLDRDIEGELYNSGDGDDGWAIGCDEYGGLQPVTGQGSPAAAGVDDGPFTAIYVLG